MSELVTVYVSVPPNGKSNPGAMLYKGVYFSVTLRTVIDGEQRVHGDMIDAYAMMDSIIEAWQDGAIQIHPECLWRDPADQRPADEQPRQNRSDFDHDNHMFINQGYKIKRMVDEGKVSYVIAFRMTNGKESQFPATISNENYLKMLVKALMDAGYKPQEWGIGEVQHIDIEFGVKKSQKVAPNGKQFNDYQYFKVKQPVSGDIPF